MAIELESAFDCGNRYFHYNRFLKNYFDLVYTFRKVKIGAFLS